LFSAVSPHGPYIRAFPDSMTGRKSNRDGAFGVPLGIAKTDPRDGAVGSKKGKAVPPETTGDIAECSTIAVCADTALVRLG